MRARFVLGRGIGSEAFPSLCCVRAEGRGLPERSTRYGRDLRTRGWGPSRSPPLAPQSKPVTQTSRLVAQETARLVSFRLGPGSWPQGQPPLDSTPISGGYVKPDLNILLGLVRGRRRPDWSATADCPKTARAPRDTSNTGFGDQAPGHRGSPLGADAPTIRVASGSTSALGGSDSRLRTERRACSSARGRSRTSAAGLSVRAFRAEAPGEIDGPCR
jgi:hypothetical protein